jgi:sugar lactone lactonase YvrE
VAIVGITRATGQGRLRTTAIGGLALASAVTLAGAGQAAARQASGRDSSGRAGAGIISTVAGGVGGPGLGTQVPISEPCLVTYATGTVYFGTHVVQDFTGAGALRALNTTTDRLTTPAGTGTAGPQGDGGPAAKADVDVCGVAVDHSGNLVLADDFGLAPRIRVVARSTGEFYGQAMTTGDIYTVAGGGTSTGNGIPASAAELESPDGMNVDSAGNLVFSDIGTGRIRVVARSTGEFYGQAMTAGDIYSVAGGGIRTRNGVPAITASFTDAADVKIDGAGNLVIVDGGRGRNDVRVVAESTREFYGQAMTAGDIYTVAGMGRRGYSGDGGPAVAAGLKGPAAIALDGTGNLVIADSGNQRIRVVAARAGTFYGQAMAAGDIYTVVGIGRKGYSGDGGPAIAARMSEPGGVALDGAGNLVIADSGNQRIRVVAARAGTFYGQAMAAGDIYTVAGTGTLGDGGPATAAALDAPDGVTADQAGDLLIADNNDERIRMVAARTRTSYGQAMAAGDIYTVAGGGTSTGDGGPASAARLNNPQEVVVDSAGNLMIAETFGERIRVVADHSGTFYGQAMTAGDIYTIAGTGTEGSSGDGGPASAAELSVPAGVAVDAAGDVVIADTGNHRIRFVPARSGEDFGQPMTAGDIYTIVLGPASRDGRWVQDVVFDAAGNVVFTNQRFDRTQVVAASTGTFYQQAMTVGGVYTLTGGHYVPGGAAIDSAGNVLITDSINGRVLALAETTGTFYGITMTAGHVYTVAGDGTQGFGGDGGRARQAELAFPEAVTADGSSLVIADWGNNRMRLVTGG